MKILDLTTIKKTPSLIKKIIYPAVETIKNGGIVIFPTETVYGLGADCFNSEAVKKVFITKNRPYYDPLIVHISKKSQMFELVKNVDNKVKLLIKTFWPGPLSIVLKKSSKVPDIVTANKDTVCIRMPSNLVAKIFIDMCGVPIAAPSANIFSRVSATSIEHILKDFSKKEFVEYIIYDGNSQYGLESTIVDCTMYPFKILRYGSITPEEIRKKTGLTILENFPVGKKVFVSGMFKKHYSPTKNSFLTKNLVKYLELQSKQSKDRLEKIIVVCSDKTKEVITKKFDKKFKLNILTYGKSFKEIAKNLYYVLRKAENMDGEFIVIEPVSRKGLGKTIMDRLTKACEGKWVENQNFLRTISK